MRDKTSNLLSFSYAIVLSIWLLFSCWQLADLHIKRWPICLDFVHFYQCGAMTMSSDHYAVYDPKLQIQWTNKLIAPQHVDDLWFIQYVPFVFPLMTPFSCLPLPVSFLVWTAVSAVWGAGFLVLAGKENSRPPGGFARAAFCIGALACFPSWQTFWWGQLTWFYVGFLLMYFLALKKGKDVLAGFALALVSIKPQYLFFFAIAALAGKKKKLLLCFAGFELLLLLLSGLTIGWHNVFGYPQVLMMAEEQGGQMGVSSTIMVSLRGLLSYFLPQKVVLVLSFALMAVSLPALFFIWRSAWRKGSEQMNRAMALTVVMALLVSPHTHAYDCLFLAIPAALTLQGLSFSSVLSARPAALLVWSWILYTYPAVSWIMFLSLNPAPDARLYPFAFGLANVILLACGLSCFARPQEQSNAV